MTVKKQQSPEQESPSPKRNTTTPRQRAQAAVEVADRKLARNREVQKGHEKALAELKADEQSLVAHLNYVAAHPALAETEREPEPAPVPES